jgi:hypothetical protein
MPREPPLSSGALIDFVDAEEQTEQAVILMDESVGIVPTVTRREGMWAFIITPANSKFSHLGLPPFRILLFLTLTCFVRSRPVDVFLWPQTEFYDFEDGSSATLWLAEQLLKAGQNFLQGQIEIANAKSLIQTTAKRWVGACHLCSQSFKSRADEFSRSS